MTEDRRRCVVVVDGSPSYTHCSITEKSLMAWMAVRLERLGECVIDEFRVGENGPVSRHTVQLAQRMDIPVRVFRPRDPMDGFCHKKLNKALLYQATEVILVWDGESRSVADLKLQAEQLELPVFHGGPNGDDYRRFEDQQGRGSHGEPAATRRPRRG